VHRIIYDELCLGVVREESRQVYRDVIARLVRDGAEGVVLGCTEIELLVSEHRQHGARLSHHPTASRSRR
jgi:aspartate/glutamate racemase